MSRAIIPTSLFVVLAACGSDGGARSPDHVAVVLPADDALHPSAPLEWHYWTGHLRTDTGRWFGFEEVFFTEPRGSMAHVAVTDVEAGSFEYVLLPSATKQRSVANGFDFVLGVQAAHGGDGSDTLHGATATHTVDLTLSSAKSPVMHFGDGYTEFVGGGNTYYYSRERLAASGTVSVNGEVYAVTGTAWFDHQWGDLASAGARGWQWFALQLDDDRELMVFELYDTSGHVAQVSGTYDDGGTVTTLSGADVTITALGTWTSPHTSCVYSSAWVLSALGQSFTVTPLMRDQELHGGGGKYWEGAATVTGDGTGRAYVELTTCP